MILFAVLVTFTSWAATDAAVLAAGHIGFALGATSTAIANMQAITNRPLRLAFLLVPVTGAFLVDITNALLLQGFLTLRGSASREALDADPPALALSLGLVALLVGCGSSTPGQRRSARSSRNAWSRPSPSPVLQLTSLRRLGSGPLSAAADGSARRLAYYNATLTFARDFDLLVLAEPQPRRLRQPARCHREGDLRPEAGRQQAGRRAPRSRQRRLRHGRSWRPQAAVRTAVAAPPPENNTGPPAVARQIIEGIQALFADTGQDQGRRDIITEELEGAYDRMQLRLDRLGASLRRRRGAGGRRVPGSCPANRRSSRRHRRHDTRGRHGRQRRECRALHDRRADAALVQNDIAALAGAAQGPFASDPPLAELRALASLFPGPCTSSWPPTSPIASLADLRGKRVEIGLPDPARASMPWQCSRLPASGSIS